MKREVLERFVREESVEPEEEGYDVSEIKKSWGEIDNISKNGLTKILTDLSQLPLKPDFPF